MTASRPGASPLGCRGQSTVEYAAVLCAFLALAAACAALWHAAADGHLTELAAQAASHGFGQGTLDVLKDVLLF